MLKYYISTGDVYKKIYYFKSNYLNTHSVFKYLPLRNSFQVFEIPSYFIVPVQYLS